jgi:hypothetical protein
MKFHFNSVQKAPDSCPLATLRDMLLPKLLSGKLSVSAATKEVSA